MQNKTPIFIVLTGPSGVGKTTIAEILLQRINNSTRLITTTTRQKRPTEVDGIDYDFVTTKEFLKMKSNGEFFEYALVYSQYYGSRKTNLENLQKKYSIIFSVVDVEGAKTIRKKISNSITIFISPDSVNELNSRLLKRSCRSPEELKNRIKKAAYEISTAQEFDIIIKNPEGRLDETINTVVEQIQKRT